MEMLVSNEWTSTKKEANGTLALRSVLVSDLPIFYRQQLDPEANYLAAFTRKNPANRRAFCEHWQRILASRSVNVKTIVVGAKIAGHVACFGPRSEREITYWLGREYWGCGIATQAVGAFVRRLRIRPLYARVAEGNRASRRVLEKSGFVVCRLERDFAEGRGHEVEETVMQLRAARASTRRASKLQ
ncbi:MAG: GNAT family N-acetyltransferase [Vulcanimicrobiaceae bacterium]